MKQQAADTPVDIVDWVTHNSIEKERWPGKALSGVVTDAINQVAQGGGDMSRVTVAVRPTLPQEPKPAALRVRVTAPRKEA